MTTTPNTRATTSKPNLALWLLLLIFALPFIAATTMYLNRHNLEFQTTQSGTLIQPIKPLSFQALYDFEEHLLELAELNGKWRLIYLAPPECNENCLARKKVLTSLHIALGKYQPKLVLAAAKPQQIQAKNDILGYDALKLSQGSLIVVDPQGNFMMHYQPSAEAKGILKDMKKLLKHSNVG